LQTIEHVTRISLNSITNPLASSISKPSQSDLDHSERLRTILQNMPVIVTAFSQNATYAMWNREAERVTGYAAEEIVGNPKAVELLYPDPAYREKVLAEWMVRKGHFNDWETEICCKDGRKKIVAWSSISAEVPISEWSGWGSGIDVTAQ